MKLYLDIFKEIEKLKGKTLKLIDGIEKVEKADAMAEIDVEVLASAFNLDKADSMGRVIQFDGFENEEAQYIIFSLNNTLMPLLLKLFIHRVSFQSLQIQSCRL